MASRYIPPHLRNKKPTEPAPETTNTQSAKPSFEAPTWYPQERSGDDLYTIQEMKSYFWKDEKTAESTHNATLRSAAENPHRLAWVLLFNGANPNWDSDGIIFVKSNLDLLPAIQAPVEEAPEIPVIAANITEDEPGEEGGVMLTTYLQATDDGEDTKGGPEKQQESSEASGQSTPSETKQGVPVNHLPIAIFSQTIQWTNRCFKFNGWYKIARLELVEPNSKELERMLKKKWETVDRYGRVSSKHRDVSKWEESMSYRWAVVKMEKD
ncbi:hypothetical protein EJ02DRAFT_458970, partial [Clathrospora elynae]